MRILPRQTKPADVPLNRRHHPATRPYRDYRRCLRWEFGHTCAFCLLHEADLVEGGAEGTALTWIEHLDTRWSAPERADDYKNCYYSCRFCNRARGTQPLVADSGARLLDPCAEAWALHFVNVGDELRPVDNDVNAAYTAELYDINDPRKVERRRRRRETLAYAERVWDADADEVANQLLDRIDNDDALALARTIQDARRLAFDLLSRYALVPGDADPDCLCAKSSLLKPPEWLETQAMTMATSGPQPLSTKVENDDDG